VVNQAGAGLTVYNGSSFVPAAGGAFYADKVISCLMELSPRRVLIGCRYNGFFLYDPVTGASSEPFPDYPSTAAAFRGNQIYHGIILPDGNLAVATLSGGTFIISPEGRMLKLLNRSHGLRDNVNYFLGLSNESNLWICTSNGISSFNTNSPFILWDYNSGIDGIVLDIEEYQGDIYIGTLTGLYRIRGTGDQKALYQPGAGRLLESEVWSLVRVNRNGRDLLLAGTGNGLVAMNGGVPEVIRQGGLILKVMPLRSDPDVLLAMQPDKMDVFRWNGSQLRAVKSLSGLFTGLRSAAEDNSGNLWIGTRNGGVVRLPVDQLTGDNLPAPAVFHFDSLLTDVMAYQGQVLFGNTNGLFSYNYATREMERCRLFGPDVANARRMISTLKKDARGNIWIGGEDILLARPDGTYTFEKLNFQQIEDVFSAFVFLHIEDQKTWIGGNNGVYLYDSRVHLKLPEQLQAMINRIEVLGDTTLFLNAASAENLAKGSRTGGRDFLEIDLAKSNSQVTFSFSVPFFENEKNTQFSYRLEGYQEEWSPWASAPQVTYSNLKPARYRFEVKGKTIFNQESLPAEVRFTVPIPWYRSNFLYLVYLLLLAAVIYFIASYISRIRVRKQLRIEDLIRKRMQETNRSQILNILSAGNAASVLEAVHPATTLPAAGSVAHAESSDNHFLISALKILEANMGNHAMTAGDFCKEMGMSQAKVYRKLIALTGMSINEFIRNIRLKKAAQLLLETDLTVSEIAYETGFSSPGYFTKCFTAEFGQTPRDFSHKKHSAPNS
jgi:AraC-like DNA-binding protein/ligand-binding sensor domain-containing protein